MDSIETRVHAKILSMLPEPKPQLTPEEYLAFDRSADGKSEYLDGEMFAMSGGSRAHSLIASNLIGEIHQQLRGRPCEVHGSDLRVLVESTGLYTYPDLSIVCGEPDFGSGDPKDTLRNPTLLIEVLSPSTENYDRSKKFEHYRSIPSLREYVLVAQDRAFVERLLRRDDGVWEFTEFRGLHSTITLPSIDVTLAFAEMYAKVKLG